MQPRVDGCSSKLFLGNPLKVKTPYVENWFGPDIGGAMIEWSVPLAIIFSIPVMIAVGIAMERGLIKFFYKRPHADVRDLYAWADRFRSGVIETADQRTGAARDYDVRADRWIATETVAQFAPLLCGGLPHDRERTLLRLLEGPRFCGHPDLAYALIPSTSPVSRDFRPREYWRGPVWPVMTWLFAWCFARRGWAERSSILRREGLRQASDGTFAEYYEPFTGEPLGSMQQSWTAAAVLDWLG